MGVWYRAGLWNQPWKPKTESSVGERVQVKHRQKMRIWKQLPLDERGPDRFQAARDSCSMPPMARSPAHVSDGNDEGAVRLSAVEQAIGNAGNEDSPEF